METAKLILEYVKVILTAPVLFTTITGIFIFKFNEDIKALLSRIAKIKLPGGTEVSTHQSNRSTKEEGKKPPNTEDVSVDGIPTGLTSEQQKAIEDLIRSHIANTYLWEYRCLNYYLVRNTQVILDWFATSLSQGVIYAYYDSFWLPHIPSENEREAIIHALENHHLIEYNQDTKMLSVTPKGHEYRKWRGELPPP